SAVDEDASCEGGAGGDGAHGADEGTFAEGGPGGDACGGVDDGGALEAGLGGLLAVSAALGGGKGADGEVVLRVFGGVVDPDDGAAFELFAAAFAVEVFDEGRHLVPGDVADEVEDLLGEDVGTEDDKSLRHYQ